MSEQRENSGLIDLDALLKQADATPLAAPVAKAVPAPASPPVTPAPSPATVARAPANVAPAPMSSPASGRAPRAVDSLDAFTTEVASNPKLPAPALPSATAAAAPVRRVTVPATTAAKRASGRKTIAMVALGAAIVATAVTITFSRQHRVTPPATAAATVTTSSPAAAVAGRPHEQPAIDPTALLPASEAPAAATTATAVAAAAKAATLSARAVAPTATTTKGEASVALGDVNASAPGANADLGGAMRSAVGERATTNTATDDTSGGSAGQVRPSQGAVVGAINSVLPGARACLGPDDAVRSALVVFKSDGTVKAVEIRGSKEEDACVKGELAKARVAPFADDSFSTRVTVRP